MSSPTPAGAPDLGAPATAQPARRDASAARRRRHLHAVAKPSRRRSEAALDASSEADIPPPSPRLVQKLGLYAFEALDGTRVVAQLGGWITAEVAAQLLERRAARTERRTLYRDQRRTVPVPGRVHVNRPFPHIAEAVVVLDTGVRSTAIAIRLEFIRQRWKATELTVL